MNDTTVPHYLLASDFDQTLSFKDSGLVLSEMLGIANFEEKVDGLARSNLVQQGGELAYLIRHDPAFRGVRREHLMEAGKRVRLKGSIPELIHFLASDIRDCRFSFAVISAAPREVAVAALEGIVSPDQVYGAEFDFDPVGGEVTAVRRLPAGYGKVAVIDELAHKLGIRSNRVIYVGDGSSDVHVMLHVNNGDGFTIAVSENRQLARIAKTTVLSDNAFSILLPILDQQLGWRSAEIRRLFEANGLILEEWQRARTDRARVSPVPASPGERLRVGVVH